MHCTFRFLSPVLLAFVVLFAGAAARAQETSTNNSFNLFVGSMLPNQIEGVTEILPVFGARYGLGTPAGVIEFGGINSHANGVDFTTFDVSLRGDIPVMDGINGLIYAGADLHWYSKKDTEDRITDTGFHIGAGGSMHLANTLWLRSDLRFSGGPGTALYLLFGIEFKQP